MTTALNLKLAIMQVNAESRYALRKLVERQAAVGVAVQMLQHVHKILTRA